MAPSVWSRLAAPAPSRTACRDGARPLKRICYPCCSRGAAEAFGCGMRASERLRGIRHALPGGVPPDAGILVDSLMDVEAPRVLEEAVGDTEGADTQCV